MRPGGVVPVGALRRWDVGRGAGVSGGAVYAVRVVGPDARGPRRARHGRRGRVRAGVPVWALSANRVAGGGQRGEPRGVCFVVREVKRGGFQVVPAVGTHRTPQILHAADRLLRATHARGTLEARTGLRRRLVLTESARRARRRARQGIIPRGAHVRVRRGRRGTRGTVRAYVALRRPRVRRITRRARRALVRQRQREISIRALHRPLRRLRGTRVTRPALLAHRRTRTGVVLGRALRRLAPAIQRARAPVRAVETRGQSAG